MIFDKEYQGLARRFTHYLSKESSKKYVAPGDSASYLVEWIKHYAEIDDLTIPTIYTLSHDEAMLLYFAAPGSYEMIKPAIVNGEVPRISLLEDFYLNGSKLALIHHSLKMRHGLHSDFDVMVGKSFKRESYIRTFEVDESMAVELNRRFNRRK